MQSTKDFKYWSIPPDKVLKKLDLTLDGLSSLDAEKYLIKYGENSIKSKNKTSGLFLFLNQFKNPIILILLIATIISSVTGEWIDAVIILIIILSSVTLSFFQEYSASNAIKKLRAKVQSKTVALRDGKPMEIPSTRIVPGDIIMLSAGSLIPADCLILESVYFFVNQSILTGE